MAASAAAWWSALAAPTDAAQLARLAALQLCFAMTINKSQGQTLQNRVGVELTSGVWSHGMLYVALGRVYLNYTYYINILEDAYGCSSLTVHSCVNTYTLL